ncbi:MAG: hypothetical protein MUQ27_10615 [Acidimicrobiia bacterium]|nr:hypothetical protein [Acidimicrobiia bacterium]
MTSIPKHLVKEIHAGNCVAFVGAGFSAAGVPAWAELLSAIAASSFLGDLDATTLCQFHT